MGKVKKIDYAQDYLDAYNRLRDAAYDKIKNYGKELDVIERCKQLLVERGEYNSIDDIEEDVFEDFKCENIYCCYFEGKHEQIYRVDIIGVRYNNGRVEVYLQSEDGYISEWIPVHYITANIDNVWLTVFDFMP